MQRSGEEQFLRQNIKKCHVDGTLSIRRRVFRRNATKVASASRPKQAFEVTVDSILSIMENDVHVLRTKMMYSNLHLKILFLVFGKELNEG